MSVQELDGVTNALSQQTLIGWNHALGVRTSITDPNGLQTIFQPDSFGRVTRETRADGTATVFALSACDSANSYCGSADLRSNVEITLRNASNGVLRTDSQQFDLFDRPRRTLQQLLGSAYSEVTRTYDVFGRVSAESIPHTPGSAAASVGYTYDLLGRTTRIRRLTSSSDPSNHDTAFAYQGLSVVQTDALNRNTTQRRNAIGLVAQSFDAAGSDTDYEYDAFGDLLKTRDVMGNEIVLTYNVRGMKMTSSDPDMGNWSYTTTLSVSSRHKRTRSRKRLPSRTTRYRVRELARNPKGRRTGFDYSYDSVARLSRRRIVSDATYDYDYAYDSATGQLDTLTYPTSTSSYRLALQYVYQNAMPYQVVGGGTTYWQADAVNSLGQVTQETLGNGVVTTRSLDAVTGLLSSIQSGPGGGAELQNESYLFDKLGNLTQRQNNALGLTENFYYDTLSRLDYSTLGGVTNLDMSYDAIGNVTARSDIANGATWIYHGTKKHAVVQAGSHTYGYDPNGNATVRNGQQITWTSYNYPSAINGPYKNMTFSYGPNRERFRQIYNNGSATETTMYIGGALEKVTAGVTDWRHSIVAGGKTVAIVSRKSDGTNATRYLLHDHQRSVANILNSDGTSFVSESFAAFGGRRDASTWTGPCPCPDLQKIASATRRGYTGHEMIGGHSMGLIHMNGRVQDSITGRFLSPDPFIQAPYFSQSFNRYSYTFNNPLTFTDPSGFTADDWGPAIPTIDNWVNPSDFPPCYTSIGPPCEERDRREFDDGTGGPDPKAHTTGRSINGLLRPAVLAASTVGGTSWHDYHVAALVAGAEGDWRGFFSAGFSMVGASWREAYSTPGSAVLTTMSFVPLVGLEASTARAGSIRGVNPGGIAVEGRSLNCVNCSVATDATLAGRPASALPSQRALQIGLLETHFGAKFSGVVTQEWIMGYFASRVGARGIIFGESKVAGQAGHVWNVVNQNGVVRVLDGQIGQEASFLFDHFRNFRILVSN